MSILGAIYKGATDPVQSSWKPGNYINLVAGAAADTSGAIPTTEVILTCRDDVWVEFGGTATVASQLFLRGDHFLIIAKNSTISVLRVGAQDAEVCIKIPE